MLSRELALRIPGARLSFTQEVANVMPIICAQNVELLIIVSDTDTDGAVEPISSTLMSMIPQTLLQFLPANFLLCRECLTRTLDMWAQFIQCGLERPSKLLRDGLQSQERKILATMQEAVISCDQHGKMTYINRAAERFMGLSKSEALHTPLTAIVEFDTDGTGNSSRETLEAFFTRELSHSRCLDSTLVNHDGLRTHVISTISSYKDCMDDRDGAVMVMRKVDRHYVELHHQANYDWLTDLPNRAFLTGRLNLAVSLAVRHNHQVGLMFVDLDNFKSVNDSMGHEAGDQLLKSVSKRLASCIRASDTVSRYGGDEFAVLLTEIVNVSDCERVAKKILSAFRLPHQVAGKSLVIGLSIGISIFPTDAKSCQAMFNHADKAMYEAKKTGSSQFEVYSSNHDVN